MLLSLDHPFGIGPLQFRHIFPEDPHNAYLNAFMSGGWLSGFAYLTFTAVTLVAGFRAVFFATPWRPRLHRRLRAFVCVVGESFIIDSDHWRHYLLLLGVTWGLMIASRRRRLHVRARRRRGHRSVGAWRSPVSALVWGTRGPEFKSRRSDQGFQPQSSNGHPLGSAPISSRESFQLSQHVRRAASSRL